MRTTILIANRGEIARRIIRTARRMGLRTVVVHSDADSRMPFVREADQAIRIGHGPARDSYLATERIVGAALEAGAELVHPGYGFLSEDAVFARQCAEAGLRFVGPPPAVLVGLGDKAAAKALAERVGVAVLPGYRGDDQRDEAFIEAARRIRYPVMVKPVAGGGGIGMQAVRETDGLRDALARARRVASAAFGDERLLLEKLVERPRHVEVQVLADEFDVVQTLGERDCSSQRRHQKVLEETPAPGLSVAQRAELSDRALRIAHATSYRGAGTVEFLLDEHGQAFFLEVNARLQVEHPVTEEVFGVDLVERQILIALGERLTELPAPHGHAVEVRLYAEDPSAGFTPSTGELTHLRWPGEVRVDAGYEEGDTVTRYYDPMVGKLIAYGPDRQAALARLEHAISATELLGVRSNLGFLLALVRHPDVRTGHVETGLIDRELSHLVPARQASADASAVAASAFLVSLERDARSPWSALGPWRVGSGPATTVLINDGASEMAVRLTGDGPHEHEGRSVERRDEPHRWSVNGRLALAARRGSEVIVSIDLEPYEFALGIMPRAIQPAESAEIVSPMPGVVIGVHVEPGRAVRRGELLFVVEAMKMELRIEAPGDATVVRVMAVLGQHVKRGERLAEVETPDL